MTSTIQLELTLSTEYAGLRLDQALAKALPDYSRTEIKSWIDQRALKVNDQFWRASDRVHGGEHILIQANKKQQPAWEAENIALDIIFEDDALLVINKPAGMVVHPAAGNPNKTLLNAILHHAPALQDLPRAGIVHRLDRDTTGLLVIAKTEAALKSLSKQMRKRSISRIYQAIVNGTLISGGTIDAPIDRHHIQRKKMAVIEEGRPAITHYRILEKYPHHTRIRVQLETGRTHQIRVHMAHIHHPLLGDPVYGGRLQLPKGASDELIAMLRGFKRQALHAAELGLIHPTTETYIQWEAPLPDDMLELIRVLKASK
ncbi:MAG: 23S rRNA pseudouridine(1911/1915/1917) synthase RluD [Gammaproteobacteria bacterium]|nr:23S rRNA pseudouridine(1911/1915/1917) synthase RluD [Gammaproteobacteria bacterium]